MASGCIAPIFHIHHFSHFFLCSRLGVLYFREHHSRIENLKSFTECPLSVKCLDTGVRYTMSLNSQLTCFGNLVSLWILLWVKQGVHSDQECMNTFSQ